MLCAKFNTKYLLHNLRWQCQKIFVECVHIWASNCCVWCLQQTIIEILIIDLQLFWIPHVYRLKEVEELLLLTIKSMVTVADKIHNQSRTDESLAADAGQLVDSLSLAGQATYKLNMFRVS